MMGEVTLIVVHKELLLLVEFFLPSRRLNVIGPQLRLPFILSWKTICQFFLDRDGIGRHFPFGVVQAFLQPNDRLEQYIVMTNGC